MIRAAHATAAATIAIAIAAVLVSVTYEPTNAVAITIGHLRATAVAGAVVTAVLGVGARIITEIRGVHGVKTVLAEAARRQQGQGD